MGNSNQNDETKQSKSILTVSGSDTKKEISNFQDLMLIIQNEENEIKTNETNIGRVITHLFKCCKKTYRFIQIDEFDR